MEDKESLAETIESQGKLAANIQQRLRSVVPLLSDEGRKILIKVDRDLRELSDTLGKQAAMLRSRGAKA
jgi:hypothetical protein